LTIHDLVPIRPRAGRAAAHGDRAHGAAAAAGVGYGWRDVAHADGRARDDRAAGAADAERADGLRAHPAPDGDARHRAAGGAGARDAHERSARPARRPRRDRARRQSAAQAHPLAQEPVPGAAPARADAGRAADARGGGGAAGGAPGSAAEPATGRPRAGRAHGVTGALRPALRSFSVPNYRRYFFGQLVSLSGTWMQVVAETWLVLSLTHSGVAVGVGAALQFTPMLLGGAWGGLIADRFDKRKLLIVTQTAMALPALALLTLTATHAIALWMLYLLIFARGAVNAVDNPARQAFLVELVGPERLVNAVSLGSALVNSARTIGPGIAGIVIAA